MKDKLTSPSPRTHKEAVAALMLGEVDTLLDKLEDLKAGIDKATGKHQETIKQLEAASDAYHQAVLAANLRSKNEMLAYLETLTKANVANTVEEQRGIVQKLIREAVGDEIKALKKALSEASHDEKPQPIVRWGMLMAGCILTALVTSAAAVTLIKYVCSH